MPSKLARSGVHLSVDCSAVAAVQSIVCGQCPFPSSDRVASAAWLRAARRSAISRARLSRAVRRFRQIVERQR